MDKVVTFCFTITIKLDRCGYIHAIAIPKPLKVNDTATDPQSVPTPRV